MKSNDDQQAFEDRLAGAPLDTATRLVYSDWCEENGLVEKAAWLRSPYAELHYLMLAAVRDDNAWRGLAGMMTKIVKVLSKVSTTVSTTPTLSPRRD